MPPAFGFGVGDFIAGVQLIVKVGNALRDSVGSAEEFRSLIGQLHSFETALFMVRRYAEQHRNEGGAALDELVRVCLSAIDDILAQLDEYQKHLGPANKVHKNRLKDSASKIKFALFKKDDIAKWQNTLSIHSLSIVMMSTAFMASNMEWQKIAYRSAFEADVKLGNDFIKQLNNQMETLSLESTTQSTEVVSILRQTAASMKEQNIEQEKRLKNSQDRIIELEKMGSQALQRMEELRESLASHISLKTYDTPTQGIIYFEDALGFIARFDLEWVDSFETLHKHLVVRFEDLPGSNMVKRKQYILHDARTGQKISTMPQKKRVSFDQEQRSSPTCGLSYRQIEEVDIDGEEQIQFLDGPKVSRLEQAISDFRRVCIFLATMSEVQYLEVPQSLLGETPDAAGRSNASEFQLMPEQYNSLQQQTMLENMDWQNVQAYWNPLDNMSKRDATS